MSETSNSRRGSLFYPTWFRAAAVALICAAHFALLAGSALHKSHTADEPYHIARGVALWDTGDYRMSVAHPPLINAITSALIFFRFDLHVPTEHPAWQNPKVHPADRKTALAYYLLHGNPDYKRILFMARLPVMLMSAALCALLYFAGKKLFREPRAGIAAALLWAFSPTALAHGRLATTDTGAALTVFIFALTLWRHLEKPSWKNAALCGMALGAAELSKYTSVLLLPLLPVAMVLAQEGAVTQRVKSFCGREATGVLGCLFIWLCGWIVTWAGYGFELHSFHPPAPPFEWASWADPSLLLKQTLVKIATMAHLPPPTYFYGLSTVLLDTEAHGKDLYFMGQVSNQGWWHYYPILFLIKEPAALLALIALGIYAVRSRPLPSRRFGATSATLAIGMVLFFALLNRKNIGIRHLLPVYPFLFLWISGTFIANGIKRTTRVAAWVLAGLYILSSLLAYPDYLVYMNRLVGGPDKGLRLSVVGEDWGQDLPALAAYLKQKKIGRIYYEPYGNPEPQAYGIKWDDYECGQTKPGWYAFHLVDLLRPTQDVPADCYRVFKDMNPETVLSHTIHVYRITGSSPLP